MNLKSREDINSLLIEFIPVIVKATLTVTTANALLREVSDTEIQLVYDEMSEVVERVIEKIKKRHDVDDIEDLAEEIQVELMESTWLLIQKVCDELKAKIYEKNSKSIVN